MVLFIEMSFSGKTIRYAAWAALNVIIARQVDIIVREPYMVSQSVVCADTTSYLVLVG